MAETAPEQATVHTVHADGSLTALRDDGLLVDAPAAAVAAGGWLAPRPGQRVTLDRTEGQVTAVRPPVPPA
ncbi:MULTISPECIES: hypothetical protein [unclassified Crossiella]|uniref:hypothetical protein n=1 Tax=unclassified Crossiella TaxID=2620835 RepID=UPI0020003AA9|nr:MULTISPECIES: hypothetical protein [unclassified Crossiella]MCK2242352.1 hypothetical protein [Crossiella sp. S99.2]MCK2254617.1 hypothetical protein [Crossiella sp. S99.1]